MIPMPRRIEYAGENEVRVREKNEETEAARNSKRMMMILRTTRGLEFVVSEAAEIDALAQGK